MLILRSYFLERPAITTAGAGRNPGQTIQRLTLERNAKSTPVGTRGNDRTPVRTQHQAVSPGLFFFRDKAALGVDAEFRETRV
jgi:hypothetical protein